MSETINLALTRKQYTFVFSALKLFAGFGGVGAGKTMAGSLFAIMQMKEFPKVLGFIGANTVKQLNLSTLPPFFALLDQFKIPYIFNRRPPESWGKSKAPAGHDGVISCRINGELTQILTYTLENPEAYRGIQIGWFWIDETVDTSEKAIKILFERLRGYNHIYKTIPYKGRFTTTPNGYDFMYDKFVKKPMTNSGYVQMRTIENKDNLPPNYYEELVERLGERLAKQQLNAEFISLTSGKAFEFDRDRNVDECEYDKKFPLIWSMDFNVSPMAGLVMQTDGKCIYVLDEVMIPDNAYTREAVDMFADRWKGNDLFGNKSKRAVIAWGDMAGKHRDTRGSESDLDIMLKTLHSHFTSVKDGHDYAQRFVIDSVNAVNALLNPGLTKEPKLWIDPKCENLIQDLEEVHWKPGTKELDKSGSKNKNLTHFADALKQVCGQLYPVAEYNLPKNWSQGF